jgi:DNA mismatch endonuclease (patch repair protein)
MADHLSPAQRSLAMKRVKLKNGSLEKMIQRALRQRGLFFRCHVRTLPGCPDIVFPQESVVVFVDGDFWHGWRLPVWEHKLSPFWKKKLRANRSRDRRNFRKLRSRNWKVIRIWQHQLKNDLPSCVERIWNAVKIAAKSD